MIDTLFQQPGFLAAGAALVSAPIIIHLINRMRFKRLRWAAMEFLLKAQKRNRRRLIIEQLILLLLRCMLVALVALLVSRFIPERGAQAAEEAREFTHIVLLDNSLSMNDRHKEENAKEGRTALDAAKSVITKKLVEAISQSRTNDRLILLPLSDIAYELAEAEAGGKKSDKKEDDKKAKERPKEGSKEASRFKYDFRELAYGTKRDELAKALANIKPTELRLDMAQGLKYVQDVIAKDIPGGRVVVHIFTDLREKDWRQDALTELANLVKMKKKDDESTKLRIDDLRVRIMDVAHP